MHIYSKSYRPARGGHAPGHLREAFGNAVEAYDAWRPGEPEPVVEIDGEQHTVGKVFGLLWCCTDILPGHLVGMVNDQLGDNLGLHTYAAAARALKAKLI